MKKKNIVFFMPFIGVGGVEKNLYLVSNYFSQKLDNIFICTGSIKYKNKFHTKINFLKPKNNLSDKLNIRFRYFYCLLLLFRFILKNKNTIVFCFQANVYCVVLCKILNIKIIVRCNTSPTGWHHNFIKRYIYKKIISLADEVITNSLEFKKEMKINLNINSKCIYNPLNKKEILKKSKEKTDFKFFDNKKYLRLINVARLTDQKDLITILKSAEFLKSKKINFKLLLIGSGDQEKKLKNFIEDKQLKSEVKVLKSQDNPYKFINKSDIFILSSKYEGLPNVLIEAALLRKIIITTNCPTGPKEIILNGKGGVIFEIGNYIDLSNKIIQFKKNKQKFNQKIKTIYKSLDRFDLKSNLEKYYKVIEKYI